MKFMNNFKIGTKLLAGFIVIAIFALTIGAVGIISLNGVVQGGNDIYEINLHGTDLVGRMSSSYQKMRVMFYCVLYDVNATAEEEQKYLDTLNAEKQNVIDILAEYKTFKKSEDHQVEYEKLNKAFDEYIPVIQKALNLISEEKHAESRVYVMGDARQYIVNMQDAMTNLMDYNKTRASSRMETNTKTSNSALVTIIIITAASFIIAIALGLYISRIISKPVNDMVKVAEKLSVGDLDVDVTVTSKDEIGELMHAFGTLVDSTRRQAELVEKIADGDMTVNAEIRSDKDLLGSKLSQMLERLNELLSNISNASEQVAAGSRQVSDSSVQLSQGATEQASSLEELTSSVEQISSQTRHNAENALEANKNAENAKLAAETGSEHMGNMLSAMDEINESSNNINKIIKVIDDIAFQTNILALNAAVEAARAGQHGKGFAVVAEEVRNLASKSANAAKETAALIEGSIKKVEGGTKIAASTSSSLKEIVGSVSKVAKLVGDIAVASNEQASGIAQINQGLMQVSQVVQSNSATSEESAAASEQLTSQAEMLRRQVESFKLKNSTRSYSSREEVSLNSDMDDIFEKMKLKKKTPAKNITTAVKKNTTLENNFGKY
ncbi:MAG: methyl-accepting chemotaxis protein [Eubacteriales bacterium]